MANMTDDNGVMEIINSLPSNHSLEGCISQWPIVAWGINGSGTVKPVCNDHLYYKIYGMWLIQ